MARKHCKCTVCSDVLWFAEGSVNQTVICPCKNTTLTESGPTGSWTTLSPTEKEALTEGIARGDLFEMRAIFDDKLINRPRHCFRWNTTLGRWELSEVAPADRTLIAYREGGEWVEV